jgi:acyl-CoA thioesterase
MTAHNESRSWQERRSLLVYTTIGAMPTGHNALVLHACAHLYLSDKHSLEFAAAHTSLEKRWTAMASLSHTVIFHTSGLALVFGQTGTEDGQQQEEKWFVQEVWTDRVVDGRIVHKSKIYSEDGVHVASTMQDGLLRLAPDADQDVEGEPKGWGARRKRLSKM